MCERPRTRLQTAWNPGSQAGRRRARDHRNAHRPRPSLQFAFTRLPPRQWKSARTSNAIERLHEEVKRRIKTRTVLPSAGTAAMPFRALLASGQITMRKVDGWQTLAEPVHQPIDLAA